MTPAEIQKLRELLQTKLPYSVGHPDTISELLAFSALLADRVESAEQRAAEDHVCAVAMTRLKEENARLREALEAIVGHFYDGESGSLRTTDSAHEVFRAARAALKGGE